MNTTENPMNPGGARGLGGPGGSGPGGPGGSGPPGGGPRFGGGGRRRFGGGPRGMGAPVEKPKDFKGTWLKLIRYCRSYLPIIIIALVIAGIATVPPIYGPHVLKQMTDGIEVGIKPRIDLGSVYQEIIRRMLQAQASGQDPAGIFAPPLVEKLQNPDVGVNLNTLCEEIQQTWQEAQAEERDPANAFANREPSNEMMKLSALLMQQWEAVMIAGQHPASIFANPDLTIMDPQAREVLDQMQQFMAQGIDPLTSGIDMDLVIGLALLLVCLYITSGLLGFTENFIMATIAARVSKKLRTGISDKVNKLPLKYFDKTSFGDVISRVTNDVDAIGMTLNQSLDMLVRAVTMFLGCLVMMTITNGIMALTAVVSSLLGFALMMLIMSKSQKYFAAQQKGLGEINGHVEEMYSGHNVIKAYNGGKESKRVFEKINGALYDSAWKSQFMSGLMMPLMMFVGNFGYVAVCVVGALLVMNGSITFGVIVAFMLYIRLFTQPLSQVAQAMQALQRGAAASERVFEFFEEEEMTDELHATKALSQLKGDVEFKNVHFGYDKDKPVIHNFSAQVKAGQKIAIVGPTGAGKTTIVNLLMRFYDLDSGEILLDGTPTHTVTREAVHEQFSMVLQDTWLFEGTIKENIIYSKTHVPDEEVVAACKAVGLHHFIQTLSKGYETILNDQTSISTGQRQLLTIARAMIQNAPLLILDEATSSVDTRTERIVQEAMNKLMAGRTSFVIAHRLSTIRNADLILVIQKGDIVESGSHTDLLAQGGFYAELYNSQFEEKEPA
ncbi:MAG: ABC transporter ATP-binding protein/permease [Peptococcaceae bacterium]|nr:ABC transporter ATP-binding protein/permease [Peptococcaceae bacterium]